MGPVPTAGSIGKVALDPLAGRLSVTAAAGTWTFGVGKYRDLLTGDAKPQLETAQRTLAKGEKAIH